MAGTVGSVAVGWGNCGTLDAGRAGSAGRRCFAEDDFLWRPDEERDITTCRLSCEVNIRAAKHSIPHSGPALALFGINVPLHEGRIAIGAMDIIAGIAYPIATAVCQDFAPCPFPATP